MRTNEVTKVVLAAILAMVACGPARAAQEVLKGPDGKTIAVIYACESCPDGKKENCTIGVAEGVHDGKPCGQCLMKANYGKGVPLPRDLRMFGHLKDEKGQPIKGKFVRVYLPNNWSARARSADEGLFVVRLGATGARVGEKPMALDLGDRVLRSDSKDNTYTFYMLREGHAPCEAKQ